MEPTVAVDARLLTRTMTGDTSYWKGLVKALVGLGGGAKLLLYSNSPRPSGIPWLETVEWKHLPGRDRWWSLYRFPLDARRSGANVLHTQYFLSPLALNGVTTVHDVSFAIGPEWFRPRDRVLLNSQVPASMRRAKRVLAVSQTTKDDIARLYPDVAAKVRVTPNAVGDNVRPMPVEEARKRVDALGAPETYVLTVGTRWPRKNMSLAIEAALSADVPVVVTGKPGFGPERSGAVVTGYVSDEDLTALYQCASLYLAPAFHEGFGIPLLEAFSCSCPVLCSPGGALPEVSGGAACVAPDFEPETWAALIRRLLADSSKLEEMRARGRDRVKDFNWRSTARLTLDAYREACA
ncbi:MAG: glycosyltransferase family 4 protein [Armatimonadetes bacterium]|nr:glycosyltransferase family 4 protein [Armatimonadota bacterium]